jgi:hypothetical protein
MMFSLETILGITGDVGYADQLEKIAFNALPAQVTDDFMNRQYFQQANQVMISRQTRNFDQNHGGTDVCYGLLTGYPCCTSNMHQGWPKFTQSLWYATPDKGLAALVFSPCEVTAKVADGTTVNIVEETVYPFGEGIRFRFAFGNGEEVKFPFHIRIPAWCKKAIITINGVRYQEVGGNQITIITRTWKTGDIVQMQLPMHVFKNAWYENSVSVERGPLVYALKMTEEWKKVENNIDPVEYGRFYYEVHSPSPWNYGLIHVDSTNLQRSVKVIENNMSSVFPWNAENAPIQLKMKARRIPSWGLYNGMAGPIPFSMTNGLETGSETEEIMLIPYGCTNLRISQFPEINK